MSKYKVLGNYVIFKELGIDAMGKNFRVGEIREKKILHHKILTDIYPFLIGRPEMWNRTEFLLEGIKKSSIPNLYSPEEIIKKEDSALLVYPFLEGRSLRQILEDAQKKKVPIKFEFAFSIALAIADLIDIGSSITLKGKNTFHGFLTPDNIMISYRGEIFLKYYGIWHSLDKSEEFFSEMIDKHSNWLAPEFIRREQIIYQSDLYYLGYIIYRMLTGEYFSYLPGEDFESTFTNIRFTHDIPSTDKDFLTNILTFFKKTLNPDLAKRFSGIREFKTYISRYFHVEESSILTSNLAAFMRLLYFQAIEEEEKALKEELSYTVPRKSEGGKTREFDNLVESISPEPEEKRGSKAKYLALISLFIIVVVFAIFLYLNQEKEVKERQMEAAAEMNRKIVQLEQKYRQQIEALKESYENRKSGSDEDRKAQREERDQLIKKIQQQKEKEIETLKRDMKKQAQGVKGEETSKPPPVKSRQPQKEEKKREVPLLALDEVTEKPVKISGEAPQFSSAVRETYAGREGTAQACILIDEKGNVSEVNVVNQTPDEVKSAIVGALQEWKYRPALKDGAPARVKVMVPVEYRFDKKEEKKEEKKAVVEKKEKTTPEAPLVPLGEVSIKPIKISGENPRFSTAIRQTYAGRRATVHSDILIDENGDVTTVKVTSNVPDDIKRVIVNTLREWKYKPALKDNVKVKVWLPVTTKISFR